jgi:hypothetical protein
MRVSSNIAERSLVHLCHMLEPDETLIYGAELGPNALGCDTLHKLVHQVLLSVAGRIAKRTTTSPSGQAEAARQCPASQPSRPVSSDGHIYSLGSKIAVKNALAVFTISSRHTVLQKCETSTPSGRPLWNIHFRQPSRA